MSSFILDASVSMAWCFEDERTKTLESILKSLKKNTAFTSSLWPLEVTNTLLVAERKDRISMEEASGFLNFLQTLPVLVDEVHRKENTRNILILARAYKLSAYDASYLELALRTSLPLATLDTEITGAAKRCGVKLLKTR